MHNRDVSELILGGHILTSCFIIVSLFTCCHCFLEVYEKSQINRYLKINKKLYGYLKNDHSVHHNGTISVGEC